MSLQPPYHDLPSAYFLHYLLLFQTRRNRVVFIGQLRQQVKAWLEEICVQEDYHLLASQVQDRRLEMLLSLKPAHSISKVVEKIKTAISKQTFALYPEVEDLIGRRNLWANAYKVESVGAASTAMIKAYLDSQREHHVVQTQEPRTLVRYSAPDKKSYQSFRKGKVVYRLNHHYVFSVKQGLRVLDEEVATYLTDLWLKICQVKQYELLSLEILDTHAHCLVSLKPKHTPQEVAETLMNNTSFLALQRFPRLREQFSDAQLWVPGFFVRSVGERTTAQVKSYFGKEEDSQAKRCG
jgi:putative transposase